MNFDKTFRMKYQVLIISEEANLKHKKCFRIVPRISIDQLMIAIGGGSIKIFNTHGLDHSNNQGI